MGVSSIEFQALPGPEARPFCAEIIRQGSFLGSGGGSFSDKGSISGRFMILSGMPGARQSRSSRMGWQRHTESYVSALLSSRNCGLDNFHKYPSRKRGFSLHPQTNLDGRQGRFIMKWFLRGNPLFLVAYEIVKIFFPQGTQI